MVCSWRFNYSCVFHERIHFRLKLYNGHKKEFMPSILLRVLITLFLIVSPLFVWKIHGRLMSWQLNNKRIIIIMVWVEDISKRSTVHRVRNQPITIRAEFSPLSVSVQLLIRKCNKLKIIIFHRIRSKTY